MAAIAAGIILTAGIATAVAASQHHPAPDGRANTAAHSSAACSELTKSPNRPATYELLIIGKTVHLYGLNPTTIQAHLAHELVAAEVRAYCPQFSYLAHA